MDPWLPLRCLPSLRRDRKWQNSRKLTKFDDSTMENWPIPSLDFYIIVFTFQHKTFILDQAHMIVELNRKDMEEQHWYEEIPDTEILIKIVYGIHRPGSDFILLCNSAIWQGWEISRYIKDHDKYSNSYEETKWQFALMILLCAMDIETQQKEHGGAALVWGDFWHWDINEDNLPWDTPTGFWLHPPLQFRNMTRMGNIRNIKTGSWQISKSTWVWWTPLKLIFSFLFICLNRGTATQLKTFWDTLYI